MKILFKSLLYAFLLTILFVVSLYHVPQVSEILDDITDSQISADIKLKINHLLGNVGMIDKAIDGFGTNTKGNINSRIETFENLSE